MYYRGAAAAIIVFDITKRESFDGPNGAKSWVKELQRRGDADVVICLAGNKLDLEHERQVKAEEVLEYARGSNLLYTETSARTGKNVQEMFRAIAERLPKTRVGAEGDGLSLRKEPK